MTLILSAAAEAAATRTMKPARIRRNRMHSSFNTRKGLGWTVHAGLLASRVRTPLSTFDEYKRPSRVCPSDRLRFPRLQLRGSAGFSPASLLVRLTRVREPKKL